MPCLLFTGLSFNDCMYISAIRLVVPMIFDGFTALSVDIITNLPVPKLHLDGGDIRIEAPEQVAKARIATGEVRARAMMSEANLNRLIAANLPADVPIRGLSVALLSGRARISGKALISIVPFPFSIEATPRIENGVRVSLDCSTATLGVDMPRAVVDILQSRINDALGLDVSALEIPIWLDEIKCEPGRITAIGRARIVWPPATATPAAPDRTKAAVSSGFTASANLLLERRSPAGALSRPHPAPERMTTLPRRFNLGNHEIMAIDGQAAGEAGAPRRLRSGAAVPWIVTGAVLLTAATRLFLIFATRATEEDSISRSAMRRAWRTAWDLSTTPGSMSSAPRPRCTPSFSRWLSVSISTPSSPASCSRSRQTPGRACLRGGSAPR